MRLGPAAVAVAAGDDSTNEVATFGWNRQPVAIATVQVEDWPGGRTRAEDSVVALQGTVRDDLQTGIPGRQVCEKADTAASCRETPRQKPT